jgi:hypothetical protein
MLFDYLVTFFDCLLFLITITRDQEPGYDLVQFVL